MADMVEQQLRQLGEYLESETGVSLRSGEPITEPRPFDGRARSGLKDSKVAPRYMNAGPDRPHAGRRRLWLVGAAAAAVLVMVIVTLLDGDDRQALIADQPFPSVEVQPGPIEAIPDPDQMVGADDPTHSEQDPVEGTTDTLSGGARIAWTTSMHSFDRATTLLTGDGDWFYLVSGTEVSRSLDGHTWTPVVGRFPASGPSIFWEETDAASGKILRLTIESDPGGSGDGWGVPVLDLFDAETGEATRQIAEFPHRPVLPSDELRGDVAINREGEAVVAIYAVSSQESGPDVLYRSADDSTWTQVGDDTRPTGDIIQVTALGDGFVASADDPQLGPRFWYSEDGLAWTERVLSREVRGTLRSWNDAAIVYQESAFGLQALSANPAWLLTSSGVTDLVVDLEPLETGGSYGPAVAAAGLGIVSLAPASDEKGDDDWFVEFSPDGVGWTREAAPFRVSGLGLAYQPVANATTVLVPGEDALWVGTVVENHVIVFDGIRCRSTPGSPSSRSFAVEIDNTSRAAMAVIVGTYREGFNHEDLVAYAETWPGGTDRPDFVNAMEILEVPASAMKSFELDLPQGRYSRVCMGHPATVPPVMVTLADIIVD